MRRSGNVSPENGIVSTPHSAPLRLFISTTLVHCEDTLFTNMLMTKECENQKSNFFSFSCSCNFLGKQLADVFVCQLKRVSLSLSLSSPLFGMKFQTSQTSQILTTLLYHHHHLRKRVAVENTCVFCVCVNEGGKRVN
jgi:hypothetical protein